MLKKHPYEERLLAVKLCLGGRPLKSVARQFGINKQYISEWLLRYEREGESGLQKRSPKKANYAEQCGYFVIIKKLRSAKRGTYHGKRVYQLFLSPIHPKKRREMNSTSEQTITISPLVGQYRLAA